MEPARLRLRRAQLGWRAAQEDHSLPKALAAIFAEAGVSAELPLPRASVVTPAIRPELLEKTLEQFRSQTWENKELVVANSNDPAVWRTDLIDPARGEQIVFLPASTGRVEARLLAEEHQRRAVDAEDRLAAKRHQLGASTNRFCLA